jgi:hypothetical protein
MITNAVLSMEYIVFMTPLNDFDVISHLRCTEQDNIVSCHRSVSVPTMHLLMLSLSTLLYKIVTSDC